MYRRSFVFAAVVAVLSSLAGLTAFSPAFASGTKGCCNAPCCATGCCTSSPCVCCPGACCGPKGCCPAPAVCCATGKTAAKVKRTVKRAVKTVPAKAVASKVAAAQ